MLKPADIQRLSDRWELICEKRFKRMGYTIDWLDKGKAKRMPEFVVLDSKGPVLVCEAKAIFSGRFLRESNAHLSSIDDEMPDGVDYEIELDKSKVDDDLSDASEKYKSLIKLRPKLAGKPLVVAFTIDFFAGDLSDYPTCMDNFPLVSGAITIVKDRKIRKWAHEMPIEELKERIDNNDMRGAPPNAKEFKVLKNQNAKYRLPRSFTDKCIGD